MLEVVLKVCCGPPFVLICMYVLLCVDQHFQSAARGARWPLAVNCVVLVCMYRINPASYCITLGRSRVYLLVAIPLKMVTFGIPLAQPGPHPGLYL